MKKIIFLLVFFSSLSNADWVLRDSNGSVIVQQYIGICYHLYSDIVNDDSSDIDKDILYTFSLHYNRIISIGLSFNNKNLDIPKELVIPICASIYFNNEAHSQYEKYLEDLWVIHL